MERVEAFSQPEKIYSKIFRVLSITRIELAGIESILGTDREKNILKFTYLV